MQFEFEKNIISFRKEIKDYNNKVWDVVFDELRKRVSDDSFRDILEYIPKARVGYGANRPYSSFLGFLYGGGSTKDDNIIKISAAMEILNTSITYIDDKIYDDDLFVGEKMALHKRYGVPIAILTSSTLRSIAREILIEYASNGNFEEILREAEKISNQADYGQYLDVTYGQRVKATIKDAEVINDLRTGQFIMRSAEIGYLLSGKNNSEERNYLHESFRLYGRAVQDTNDFDDVNFTEHSPGSHGMDIKLFKKTKPILKALQLSNEQQKEKLYNVLGNIYADDESVLEACQIIRESGALHWAVEDIKKTVDKAIQIILSSKNNFAEEIAEYFYLVINFLKEHYNEKI